jgi:phosphatidate cytidylyltransferase
VTTTTAPAPTGRAGRDLRAAIGIGLGLGGLVLGTLYSPARWTFVVVAVAAAAIGTYEVVRALRQLGAQPPVVPLLVGGAATVATGYRYGAEEVFLALALTALACVLWRLADPAAGLLRDVTSGVFTAVYVPFLVAFAAMLTAPSDGPRRVTVFIATVVCSDVGGYAAGVLLGKHPMAPSVSPKKSWEGFAGSVTACATGGAVLFVTLFSDTHWWEGALFGLAVVCSATLGDLGESMIKRDIGIKDMGHLLAGHGGLMDRLDSLLPSAPVAWLLLTAFVPLP